MCAPLYCIIGWLTIFHALPQQASLDVRKMEREVKKHGSSLYVLIGYEEAKIKNIEEHDIVGGDLILIKKASKGGKLEKEEVKQGRVQKNTKRK